MKSHCTLILRLISFSVSFICRSAAWLKHIHILFVQMVFEHATDWRSDVQTDILVDCIQSCIWSTKWRKSFVEIKIFTDSINLSACCSSFTSFESCQSENETKRFFLFMCCWKFSLRKSFYILRYMFCFRVFVILFCNYSLFDVLVLSNESNRIWFRWDVLKVACELSLLYSGICSL